MTPCEFCQRDLVEATWQLIMGSEVCGEVMEIAVCDIHSKSIKYAANLIEDKCGEEQGGPHPVDEIMMQQLSDGETVIIRPEHYNMTPQAAARIFEENARREDKEETVPSSQPATKPPYPRSHKPTGVCRCSICGKYYPDVLSAKACVTKHNVEEKWRVARKKNDDYRRKVRNEANDMANWKPDFSGGREGPY